MNENAKHCIELLREGDRERYLTVLFAPEDKRASLAGLFAFDLEIARIRDLVSEPMPGEIRLQWWRDVVTGEREGEGRQHPVASALLEAVEAFNLPRAVFENCLEARVFDLYNDPMPDKIMFEGYQGETVSTMFQMAAQILNNGSDPDCADASGHAGVAYGICGLLRLAPLHRHRRQVYVPADILEAAGLDAAGWLKGEDGDAIAQAVSILTTLARDHLGEAETALSRADKNVHLAFLRLAVVEPLVRRFEREGALAASKPAGLSPLRTNWCFLRRAVAR
jgi:15-cis-phytoene synthase